MAFHKPTTRDDPKAKAVTLPNRSITPEPSGVASSVGSIVGFAVGDGVGTLVGESVGSAVCRTVGIAVAFSLKQRLKIGANA